MPTRSGKNYLKTKLCKCSKFYIHKDFDYKCSICFRAVSGQISTTEVYIENCNKWAEKNCVASNEPSFQLLKQISNFKNDILLYNVLRHTYKTTNKFLLAKDAIELFKDNPTLKRGHIIGHIIGDWWNIISGEGKWPPFMACYYGNYNEPPAFSTTVPSRMPYSLQMKLCD